VGFLKLDVSVDAAKEQSEPSDFFDSVYMVRRNVPSVPEEEK